MLSECLKAGDDGLARLTRRRTQLRCVGGTTKRLLSAPGLNLKPSWVSQSRTRARLERKGLPYADMPGGKLYSLEKVLEWIEGQIRDYTEKPRVRGPNKKPRVSNLQKPAPW